jgi:hypothetical protein
MNNLKLMSLLAVTATSFATAALAHADAGADGPAPTSYVAGGVTAGVDGDIDWLYSGGFVEGGYHLADSWWLHGGLTAVGRTGYGSVNSLSNITLEKPDRGYLAIRLGAESRRCGRGGALCLVAGADAAERVGTFNGWQVVPRVLLDLGLGDSGLRLRTGVEALLGRAHGVSNDVQVPELGLGVTAGLGYAW